MPRLAAQSQTTNKLTGFCVLPSGEGALSADHVYFRNVGRMFGEVGKWVEHSLNRDRQGRDTERLANLLEAHGCDARQPGQVTALDPLTGCHDLLDSWRNINFLPSVAARNRAPALREVGHWMGGQREAKYFRYAVVTTGARVPLFGDLRGRMRALHRIVSKWADRARKFDIEVIHRASECTIDGDLTFHPHANLLYWPTRKLSAEEWREFLEGSRRLFGANWQDCGRIENLREVIKYIFKGDDLQLLADASCLADQWADGDPAAAVAEIARRMAARGGGTVDRYEGEAWAHVRQLGERVRRFAASGNYPHPVVWLAEQLSGLHLQQSFGPLAVYRRRLRENRLKVVSTWSPRGTVLEEVKRGTRPVADRERPPGSDENRIFGITLPQPRFTPWAAPIVLIANYTPNPVTSDGKHALRVIAKLAESMRKDWDAAGAPAPEVALRRTAMAVSAVVGPEAVCEVAAGGKRSAPAATDSLYGSHYYENCPGPAALDDLFDPRLVFAVDEGVQRPPDFEAMAVERLGKGLDLWSGYGRRRWVLRVARQLEAEWRTDYVESMENL